MTHDADALAERIWMLWSLGDWQALLAIPPQALEDCPQRARLALLLASAASAQGTAEQTRLYLRQAEAWGAERRSVLLALASGTYLSFARLKALQQEPEAARFYLEISLTALLGRRPEAALLEMRGLEMRALEVLAPLDTPLAVQPAQAHDSGAPCEGSRAHLLPRGQPPHLVVRERVGPALADLPVNDADGCGGFAFISGDAWQFCAYYDESREMVAARRPSGGGAWEFVRLGEKIGWDSHNYIAMGQDAEGFLHLCGNMHVSPLRYFRSSAPHDIHSLARSDRMVGRDEQQVTYPRFFRLPDGRLCFSYRDGRSGDGALILNVYEAASATWSRLQDKPLIDGEGLRNAYVHGPVLGSDGFFHLCWVWRDTPDAATNHSLSYARSPDLLEWQSSLGLRLATPITLDAADVVDQVTVGSGMINNNHLIGFDTWGRVLITYQKYDALGNTQLFIARPEEGRWVSRQVTRWSYRWGFQGSGSLPFEITFRPPYVAQGGYLVQEFEHAVHGTRSVILRQDDLERLGELPFSLTLPEELRTRDAPDTPIKANIAFPWGGLGQAPTYFLLHWESLRENRDQAVERPARLRSGLELLEIARGRILEAGGEDPGCPSCSEDPQRPLPALVSRLCGRISNAESQLYAERARFQSLEERFRKLSRAQANKQERAG